MDIGSGEVTWMQRALTAALVIDRRLYVPARGLYGVRLAFFGRRFEFLWPFACAWSAACSLGSISPEALAAVHLPSYGQGLVAYHPAHGSVFEHAEPVGFSSDIVSAFSTGGETYFDDNAWIALALLHQHAVTNEQECLDLSRRIVEFVLDGWSTNETWSNPGGIRWKQPISSTTRNVCSNAPVAEAAIELYLRTGEGRWLDWAVCIYRWVMSTLQNSENLYADHIDSKGAITPTVWTYNQGTMIGAAVLLGKATNEDRYFDEAMATANAALARFDVDGLLHQPVSFNAVFLRNLLLLDRVRPDARIRQLLNAYGDSLRKRHGDALTDLLGNSTGSPLNRSAPLVEVYALLAGAEPSP